MKPKRTSENDLVVSTGASAAGSRRKSRARTTHVPAPETPAVPAVEQDTATPTIEPSTPIAESATVAETTVTPEATYTPTHDAIAKLAYSYWESRGHQGGCPHEDWLRAEQELRLAYSPSK